MMQHQNVPSARPGQMTSVMQALAQGAGPKVLRIGVVQSGRVLEERVLKQRSSVTVGPSEKCTFVLASGAIPPNFKLFELVGQEYVLNFLEGMAGRLALTTGISDLAALRTQARRVSFGPVQGYQVPLNDEARGKVQLGETTFLFQFVPLPPVQPKPQLPVSVKGGLTSEIDWTTTVIAAFSFLLHFGAVGSIYSDWMDPVLNDDVDVKQLIETMKVLPPAPVVELPKEAADSAAKAKPDAAPKAPSAGARANTPAPQTGSAPAAPKVSDTQAKQVLAELDQLNMALLGALNANGSSTGAVLGASSDLPTGLLDSVASSNRGASQGGLGGLNLSAGGGAIRPGSESGGGLAAIGNTAASGPSGAGAATAVKAPVGNASVGGAAVSGGSVSNASAVVAGMSAGFRRCYNKGLQEDPTMKGSVRITAKVGPNGEVLSASPSGASGLSPSVVSCVAARVSGAQFAPPEGGGATIVIPVSFFSQ